MGQPKWNLTEVSSQKGRVAIVTGANTGLGYETALALAGVDAKVILACRNLQKAKQAKNTILQVYPTATLECREIDLSKLNSVNTFVAEFLKDNNQLDLLINNAGIMIPPFSLTEDGFESQMAANYFGHFLLTKGLLNILMNTANSRIVSLSSIAHKQGQINFDDLQFEEEYDAMKAYSQSKLACLIFAIELQRKLEKAGSSTLSVAAHPGISVTELMRHLPMWSKLAAPFVSPFISHKPDKGALATLRAALDESVQGGDYYGPVGLGEFKGRPVKVRPRRKAQDQELASRLWAVSEKLTGCSYDM